MKKNPGREQQVSDMLDREAIRELPVRYCHYVRTRSLEPMLDLFADDGGFEMPASVASQAVESGVFRGKQQLAEVFQAGFQRSDPWPFVHNHVVDLQGPDRATGFVYAEIRMGTQRMRTVQIVVYEDEYVKVDGRWKFRLRKLNGTPVPV
jgi:hypothetical protein